MKRRKLEIKTHRRKEASKGQSKANCRLNIDKGHAELPFIHGTGAEEDVLNILLRYHGSTASAMLQYEDDDKIKSNKTSFVHV